MASSHTNNFDIEENIKTQIFANPFKNYSCPPEYKTYFLCEGCNDKFYFESSYNEHINRTSVLIKHLCLECNDYVHFTNRCALQYHIQSHPIDNMANLANFISIEPIPMNLMNIQPLKYKDPEVINIVEQSNNIYNVTMPNDNTIIDFPMTEAPCEVITVPPDNIMVQHIIPSENNTAKNIIPSEDNTVKDIIPTKDNTVKYTISTEDNTVKDIIPTKDNTVKYTISTEDNTVKDIIPTKDNTVKYTISTEDNMVKDIPTEDNTVKYIISIEDNIVKDTIPTEDNMVKNIPTEDNTVKDIISTKINTVKGIISIEDNTIKNIIPTEDNIPIENNTVKDIIPPQDNTVKDIIPLKDNTSKDIIKLPAPSLLLPANNKLTVQPIKKLKSKKYNIAMYDCIFCRKKISSNTTFELLKRNHFQRIEYTVNQMPFCTDCTLHLPNECALGAHHTLHSSMPPFICPECGYILPTYDALVKHATYICMHFLRELQVTCESSQCGKEFSLKNYQNHIRAEHTRFIHQCQECTYIGNTEKMIKLHYSRNHIHSKNRYIISHVCCICLKRFTTGELDDHLKGHLSVTTIQFCFRYVCCGCESTLNCLDDFLIHKDSCDEYKFKKNTRSIVITMNDNLPKKPNIVKKLNTNTCQICKTKYPSLNMKCLTCLGPVSESRNIEISDYQTPPNNPINKIIVKRNAPVLKNSPVKKMKTLMPVRSIVVDNIPVIPKNSNYIIVKKNVHTAHKSLLKLDCLVCNSAFDDEAEFQKHVVIHRNNDFPYQCMKCGNIYKIKPQLIQHLKAFHPTVDNWKEYIGEHHPRLFDTYKIINDSESDNPEYTYITKPTENKRCKQNPNGNEKKMKPIEVLPFEILSNKEPPMELITFEESLIEIPLIEEPPIEIPHIEELPIEIPNIEEPPIEIPSIEELPIEVPPIEEPPIQEAPIEEPQIEEPPPIEPANYTCIKCIHTDVDIDAFRNHLIMTHRDELASYQCMECGSCFGDETLLVQHLSNDHNISDTEAYIVENNCKIDNDIKYPLAPLEKKNFTCIQCNHTTNNHRDIRDHYRKAHIIYTASFRCMECGFCFGLKPTLMNHLAITHGITCEKYIQQHKCIEEIDDDKDFIDLIEPTGNFICDVCSEVFTLKSDLNMHHRTHGLTYINRL